MVSPYGDGGASEKIASTLEDALSRGRIKIKKTFYDVDFTTGE